MKKHIFGVPILILITVLIVIVASIFLNREEEKEQEKGDINIYYISADGFSLYGVPYNFKAEDETAAIAEEVLEEMKKAPTDESCQPTIPADIMWSSILLDGTNLIIDFNTSYSQMMNRQEIFLRAGIVKTLVQIRDIHTVEFKIGGMPLMTIDDQPIGMMNADYFIDDFEDNWGVNQPQMITLFYANGSGDKLVEREATIGVVNNIPMEQLIIEALMEEPAGSGYNSPIPAGTKVIKTVTKDEICYVDLSKEFLNPMENVSAQVSLYAIVNSLVERDNVSQVQFTIEGQKVSTFRELTGFDSILDRNFDLVETK